jgi:DtxR family transcriptional regulator, Mn-dependent transcriptional regulator
LPLRDWIMRGSPSTNAMARNPSYFGSYDHCSPTGNSARERASWGCTGGLRGGFATRRDAMRCAASTIRCMSSNRGTVAEQEYLEMLFWLFEAGLPMTGANLARAMQLSAPTVHEMIGRLERDGYVARNEDRLIEFTPSGREHAESIVSRHRMIERFLTDTVGVPWDDVHEEAEKLEHAMTPRFEAYVRTTVGDAKTCPHGHPIRVHERIDGVPLADCSVGAKVTILRLENEAEDLLHYLKDSGIEPGLEGEVATNDGENVSVRSDGTTATITASVAETVSVVADPSPPPRIALPEQLVLGRERYGR